MANSGGISIGKGDRITLFGRFETVPKKRLSRVVSETGARALRDLTRASTHLVVGGAALSAFDALMDRLDSAKTRSLPVLDERRFLSLLSGEDLKDAASIPADSAASLEPEFLSLLNAFGLISLAGSQVAFKDAATLKSAERLEQDGMSWPDVIRALLDQRESPKGRHKIVLGGDGKPLLQWDDGVTTLSGQHVLPLDESEGLDDLFERALDAEDHGDLTEAARLFETCTQMDRKDALAAFNLGNVRRALGDLPGARMAFRLAISRDPKLAEAYYNLAGVFEAEGAVIEAKNALRQASKADKDFADAFFNLAQLELADENWLEAKILFERVLANGTSGPLERNAEKGLQLISMVRSKG